MNRYILSRLPRRRRCATAAILMVVLSLVASGQAANTVQDFTLNVPAPPEVPGSVTVVLLDQMGNIAVPILNEPVLGLGSHVGRPGFDARTGGAFMDQDVRNVQVEYTSGGDNIVNTFGTEGWSEVHNTAFIPQLVDDGFIRVGADGTGDQTNNVSWDSQYNGQWDTATVSFDIRLSQGNPNANDKADGFGFKWINTALHGTTGAFYTAGEEPNLSGSLGIGLDTWNNDAQDNFAFTSLSLHFNGTLLKTVNLMDAANEPTIDAPFPLETGQPISVQVLMTAGDPLTGVPSVAGGTPFVFTQGGLAPGPTVAPDVPGEFGSNLPGHLRLTPEVGSQNNAAAFDKTGSDATRIVAQFDARIRDLGGGRADGMSFVLIPTDTYGDTGAAPFPVGFLAEEPNIAGGLGLGFDTYDNDEDGAAGDPNGCGGGGACLDRVSNHVSLHWNGSRIDVNNDGTVTHADNIFLDPATELNFGSGEYHHFTITVDKVDGGSFISLLIEDGSDGSIHTPLGEGRFIPDMDLTNSRVALYARTGGAWDFHEFDNINVQFVPEPTAVSLLGLALGGLALIARRRTR